MMSRAGMNAWDRVSRERIAQLSYLRGGSLAGATAAQFAATPALRLGEKPRRETPGFIRGTIDF
jgi:hypothetical protein